MEAAKVGSTFLDFFARHGHTKVPSTSLVYNDPTLLFVNAGMVPFKPYFTGEEPAPYKRAASVQKCVRTLDIEEVGKTTRHGTFFQMNGNFSFGDYFKKEAIEWAFELVTSEQHNGGYGFDPDKVWVTILGPGFHKDYPDGDLEAKRFWMGVGIPEERIQARNLKDNYWNMGVPGPGGPCSEIYIDRGPEHGPDGGPVVDEDRFLEIWNLVFQTEDLSEVRAKDDFDVAAQLPSKNIDTGMGLERTAYLLQGKDNMYEIDQVFPVIERAAELAGKAYGKDRDDDVRLRVVGDHVRSGLMLMADGVVPGNEARGYVLRRLLRRSIRSMRLLGVPGQVLTELLEVSKGCMAEAYPEVGAQWDHIKEVAAAEDEAFNRTLTSGTALFDVAVKATRDDGSAVLAGDKAFQLHDTYGFPIDLTLEMAEEAGLSVDREKFDELMEEQRARAKADAKAKKGGGVDLDAYLAIRDKLPGEQARFLGYDTLTAPAKVRGIVVDGRSVDVAHAGETVEVVLDETPFYAEAGGQDSDAGLLIADSGACRVLDVQRPVPGLVVHKVELVGELAVGEPVTAEVDAVWRRGACQAHSATHVISAALREFVGQTATQAGSYNKPGYLRFDFHSGSGLSDALKQEIEERCNLAIADDLAVTARQMRLDDAKALGAQAMFGEKYPPIVRMVELGGPWSRELCGGTHVPSSGQIGVITLLSEASVGAGARRVEALVAADAFKKMAAERALLNTVTATLHVQPDQLAERVEKLVADLKQAEKKLADLANKQLLAESGDLAKKAKKLTFGKLVAKALPGTPGDGLRTLALKLRDELEGGPAVVALSGGAADKPALVVTTTQKARDKGIRAGDLVRVGAYSLAGKGGGKDDLAQGGGTDGSPQALDEALAAIESALREMR
jgi:alanyl-tRNA synthetase